MNWTVKGTTLTSVPRTADWGSAVTLLGAAALGIGGWLALTWPIGGTGLDTPPEASTPADAPGTARLQAVALQPDARAMADRLAERLTRSDGTAADWAMLGRSAAALGRRSQAADAWARATAGSRDADLLVEHAAFLLDRADPLSAAQAEVLLGRALQASPQHLHGLLLAGELAFGRGDVQQALATWRQALTVAQPDSEISRLLSRSLQNAHGRTPAGTGMQLAGTVQLAPALAAQVRPEDVVYVFARPADQPQAVPVAIARHLARELPLRVNLDLGEQPAGSRWVLVARVAKSGDALPRPGDLSGESAAATAGAQGLGVRIERVQR